MASQIQKKEREDKTTSQNREIKSNFPYQKMAKERQKEKGNGML